ncbi:MAG: hypothetical protein CL844_02010 [Crocinitomicaceae bacterium]|nr:hypothetical protein [Crocinitomicaceae bacterium]
MKVSKELITGAIAILAIGLFVLGINFLKGNSFFGGDDLYYAYFSNSGQLSPASSVTLNGVGVGKVLAVEYVPKNTPEQQVKVSFNITEDNIRIPIGSHVEIGSLDLFSKGMLIHLNSDLSKGYYKSGDYIDGVLAVDMISQVKSYADPISQKLQIMMSSIDKMVNGISSFWDSTATSEIEGSLKEVKIAIKRFGNAAEEIEALVASEKIKLSRILSNVETITQNLKKSNEAVKNIVGNVETITDDLVTADFKGVIGNAKITLESINNVLSDAKLGKGTLGKLLADDLLYDQLVKSNTDLQDLLNDIKYHPERYIHFSVLGKKTKGVPLTKNEEQKLKMILDTVQ